MSEIDIESLKINRIEKRDDGKRHLPISGPIEPSEAKVSADPESGVVSFGAGERSVVVPAAELRERIVEALKTIFDPEIPINIYDLGLIYGYEIGDEGHVDVDMTLTAPACPVAGALVAQVAEVVGRVDGVAMAHVKLVWDPPWTQERLSEAAMLELGLL